MQVLPVSSVANFQLSVGCRGARARAETARVPLPRGAARWCARAGSPALFCGVWEGLSTAAKMAAPHTAAPAESQCLMSHRQVSGLMSQVSPLSTSPAADQRADGYSILKSNQKI